MRVYLISDPAVMTVRWATRRHPPISKLKYNQTIPRRAWGTQAVKFLCKKDNHPHKYLTSDPLSWHSRVGPATPPLPNFNVEGS